MGTAKYILTICRASCKQIGFTLEHFTYPWLGWLEHSGQAASPQGCFLPGPVLSHS